MQFGSSDGGRDLCSLVLVMVEATMFFRRVLIYTYEIENEIMVNVGSSFSFLIGCHLFHYV